MKELYYVAHPYTQNNGVTEGMNFDKCVEICNELLDKNYNIFSPIIHSHILHYIKERDYDFWLDLDLEFLSKCDGLILSGDWKKSKGCMIEYEFAKKHGKLIYEYNNKTKELIYLE